jgi:hypothetical protein
MKILKKNSRFLYDGQIFLLVIFLATFAFPTLILIFTYGSIGIALKRHITPGNANNSRDKAILNTKVRVKEFFLSNLLFDKIRFKILNLLNNVLKN